MEAYRDDTASTPLLVAEKAPLPLAVVPPLKHVRTLQALNAAYWLQIVVLTTRLDLSDAKTTVPVVLVGPAVEAAYSLWAARRARRQRAKQALEEGWTVEEEAEKDREEREKVNEGRRRVVWVMAGLNALVATLVGVMVYCVKIKN